MNNTALIVIIVVIILLIASGLFYYHNSKKTDVDSSAHASNKKQKKGPIDEEIKFTVDNDPEITGVPYITPRATVASSINDMKSVIIQGYPKQVFEAMSDSEKELYNLRSAVSTKDDNPECRGVKKKIFGMKFPNPPCQSDIAQHKLNAEHQDARIALIDTLLRYKETTGRDPRTDDLGIRWKLYPNDLAYWLAFPQLPYYTDAS